MTTSPTMTEIDDDVMEKAEEAFNKAVDPCFERPTLVIARAIQAARNEERERCAKLFTKFATDISLDGLGEEAWKSGKVTLAKIESGEN